jgi:hypothetical protein
MSGHTSWHEIKRGSGGWHPVAGDDQALHWFVGTTQPRWWLKAQCGAGPAVGTSERDARFEACATCLPGEREDVEGIHTDV